MAKLFVNSGDPDQTPRSAASDLGLDCLPITLLRSPDYNRLAHLCQIDSSTTPLWTGPFPIEGASC